MALPRTISDWVEEIRRWSAQKGFDFNWEQAPTFLMLIVTEASEAMEAWRDDDRARFAEELADLVIRAFHMAGQLGIDLEGEVARKMAINWRRPYRHGHKRA
ncbi:nucleotide pyrophosphohydrolase [Candidatus Bathyarchaeota archaeon]|nr:MAG: nucleotide pyrophosphohydrolase [Candidatus Bathyarchaeota archaeon]